MAKLYNRITHLACGFLIIASLIFITSIVSAAESPGSYAYIANQWDNSVSVIDLATNTVTAAIPVGAIPFGVAVNPAGTKVYVVNNADKTVSVIDTATNTVTATIPVGLNPWGVAVNPSGTRVYVTNQDSNTVSVIDAATNTVTATIPVGSTPYYVTVNPSGTKIYVYNNGNLTVSVIDAATNTVTATINSNFPTGPVANPSDARIYVPNYQSVSVIDDATNTVTAIIPVGLNPQGIAVNPSGTRVYVVNRDDNSVSVIDAATNKVIATIPVGSYPIGAAVNPSGTNIYVTNFKSNTISVIDAASNTVVSTIPVGRGPTSYGQLIIPPVISIVNHSGATSTPIVQNNSSVFQGGSSSSGNNGSNAAGVTTEQKLITTVASVVIGSVVVLGWPWLSKIFDMLFSGIKSYLQGLFSTWEKKRRKPEVKKHEPLFFGFSLQEILVAVIGALLLGGAFSYVRGTLFSLEPLVIMIIVAGMTSVIHELTHRYVAYHYKARTEFKFWDVGTLTLIITSLIGQPFASPARTIIDNPGSLNKNVRGFIFLSGPIVSILLSIAFLLLITLNGVFDSIGITGFKLCIMTCVFQMIPIRPLEGRTIFEWNKLVWAVVFFPALIFYLYMIICVL